MILSGHEIIEAYHDGRVYIDPFNGECVNPNSYDLTLAPTLAVYDTTESVVLDPRKDNPTRSWTMDPQGQLLGPGELYLAATNERAGSDPYVPILMGKSSLARLGIVVHQTAGWGEHGFKGTWTLEITVTRPVMVYPGMRIAQVAFEELKGAPMPYNGRYQDQTQPVPVPSRFWRT